MLVVAQVRRSYGASNLGSGGDYNTFNRLLISKIIPSSVFLPFKGVVENCAIDREQQFPVEFRTHVISPADLHIAG